MWIITAYNGTTWKAKQQMGIFEAIEAFLKDTKLHAMDIKSVVNVH